MLLRQIINILNTRRIFFISRIYLISSIITCVLAYLLHYYYIRIGYELPVFFAIVFGIVLSFYIGSYNNRVYDQWWEARKIWMAFVNDSQLLARLIINFTNPVRDYNINKVSDLRRRFIYRHLAFLYSLKDHLKKIKSGMYKEYVPASEIRTVENVSNKPYTILRLQMRDLNFMKKTGIINDFTFSELNKLIINFIHGMGTSELISNTVPPTGYILFPKIFIWLFMVSATLGFAGYLEQWSIILGVIPGYIFLTIHTIWKVLQNPFDATVSSIDLEQIVSDIENNLLELLKDKEIRDLFEHN